jgi:hypothetical protein
MDSSPATSRRAAERHATAVDTARAAATAGRSRPARWTVPAVLACALAAVVAAPFLLPAAAALAAVALLLLAVHREDRRNAWRGQPEPVAPARFQPPLRPATASPVAAPDVPTVLVPQAAAVHVPTQPQPQPVVPAARAAVVRPRGGDLRATPAGRAGRAPAGTV